MQDDSNTFTTELPWQLSTYSEMLKDPPRDESWLVDGLLPPDGLSMVVGPPKGGKSSLTRCLAAAVTGVRNNWLGKSVETGHVLYISLEERRSTIMEHFEKLEPVGDQLHIIKNPTERPDHIYEWLAGAIQSKWAHLVIIDPIVRFLQVQDINDYATVMRAFDELIRLSRHYHVHIMCVHHRRKAAGVQFGDDPLGSMALNASVDTILSLSVDKDDYRTITGYGRDDVWLGKTDLYQHDSGWIDTSPHPHTPPLGGCVCECATF